jgi:hypothetical protein
VDAALARQLTDVAFGVCRLSAACVPALARLLGGRALKTLLVIQGTNELLLLSGAEGSAETLAAALRANNTLTVLGFTGSNVWHDAAAAEMLLSALTAHPSVRVLQLGCNSVAAADRARAGASLGALLAANAPALESLNVSKCNLGDEALGPLVDALAANTHLRVLDCRCNAASAAFVLQRLQPALLANTSLRQLMLVKDEEDDYVEEEEEEEDGGGGAVDITPELRQLEALVAERAAARDASAAAAAAVAALHAVA